MLDINCSSSNDMMFNDSDQEDSIYREANSPNSLSNKTNTTMTYNNNNTNTNTNLNLSGSGSENLDHLAEQNDQDQEQSNGSFGEDQDHCQDDDEPGKKRIMTRSRKSARSNQITDSQVGPIKNDLTGSSRKKGSLPVSMIRENNIKCESKHAKERNDDYAENNSAPIHRVSKDFADETRMKSEQEAHDDDIKRVIKSILELNEDGQIGADSERDVQTTAIDGTKDVKTADDGDADADADSSGPNDVESEQEDGDGDVEQDLDSDNRIRSEQEDDQQDQFGYFEQKRATSDIATSKRKRKNVDPKAVESLSQQQNHQQQHQQQHHQQQQHQQHQVNERQRNSFIAQAESTLAQMAKSAMVASSTGHKAAATTARSNCGDPLSALESMVETNVATTGGGILQRLGIDEEVGPPWQHINYANWCAAAYGNPMAAALLAAGLNFQNGLRLSKNIRKNDD